MNTGDLFGMADEDFQKLSGPPVASATGGTGDSGKTETGETPTQTGGDTQQEEEEEEEQQGTDGTQTGDEDGAESGGEGTSQTNTGEGGDKSTEGDNLPQDKSQEQGKTGAGETKPDGDKAPVTGSETQDTPPDYKAFYDKLMAPLKANGKTIELKSPDEAIQLMQMGANYTRKMQALAPHRKILLMLENNGLLDEGKLSFLIDIEKKNPEAIRKLIKDSGIDPLDIDTSKDSNYQEGNHRVADDEVAFRTTLDELSSNPEGVETLKVINTQWDQASKEILWKQPDVMELIHQQRGNGIYAKITTELERQKLLGQIPPNVPFLHAYKTIGDQLAAAGAFNDVAQQGQSTSTTPPAKEHVATRKATPKPPVANNDKVNAASPTRVTTRKVDTSVNPLALSDDDFMKQVEQFRGRV